MVDIRLYWISRLELFLVLSSDSMGRLDVCFFNFQVSKNILELNSGHRLVSSALYDLKRIFKLVLTFQHQVAHDNSGTSWYAHTTELEHTLPLKTRSQD